MESHDVAPRIQHRGRVEWIDIGKGLMMFLVIYGHITVCEPAIDYVYSFHMPFFFLLSGMTYRFSRETNVLRFISGRFIGLMIPYFLLNIYVAPLRIWLQEVGECNDQSLLDLLVGVLYSNADSGYKMASNTLWFLPCLFLTSVFFFLLRKLLKTDLKLTVACVLILIAMTCSGAVHGGGGLWHYRVSIMALGYYLAGYLFMGHYDAWKAWLGRQGRLLAVWIAIGLLAGFGISWYNGYVSMIHNDYNNVVLYFLSALLTSFSLIFLLMKLTERDAIRRFLKPADFIGKNTLVYIGFQVPVMKLIWYYIPGIREYEPYVFLLAFFLYFALMPVAALVDHLLIKKSHIRKWKAMLAEKRGTGDKDRPDRVA